MTCIVMFERGCASLLAHVLEEYITSFHIQASVKLCTKLVNVAP
jgi:hypothetical protein